MLLLSLVEVWFCVKILILDFEKVVALSRVLSWSHFLVLMPIKNFEIRDFYGKVSAEMSFLLLTTK